MSLLGTRKLLMISTDRKILEEGSAVRVRQVEYAKDWDEVHIIVFSKVKSQRSNVKSEAHSAFETVIAPNCWAYPTGSSSKLMDPFTAMRLGRFLIEKRSITHMTCQDPFLTSMTGVALKKQFPQVNFEIQVHTDIGSPNFPYTFGNKVRKFLALNYLPKADHVRVVSNKVRDYLIEKIAIDSAKIEVRPIVVDTEKIKNAPVIEGADLHKKYPQFEKIVLMASRLESEKNIEYTLDIWKKVVEKNDSFGLVIVGSGSQWSKLVKHAENIGIIRSVVFEEWLTQGVLYSYFKTADLFLSTSLFEGYGMTLVEAHAAGCQIASTDVGVAREVGATIIPFKNTEKSAEIIMQLLK